MERFPVQRMSHGRRAKQKGGDLAITLRQKLKDAIAQHIQHLAPHTALPSDQELMEQFGGSRDTIRHAVAELCHDGLLYKKPHKGTFVSGPVEQKAADAGEAKVEMICALSHRSWVNSTQVIYRCPLCGMDCRLTGRFSNPSLTLEQSLIVPPAEQHRDSFQVLLPDGTSVFMN